MKWVIAFFTAFNLIGVGMNFDRWIMYQSAGSLILAAIELVIGLLLLQAYRAEK